MRTPFMTQKGFTYSQQLQLPSEPHCLAQTTAILSYIDPVLAVILSTVILRENMDIFGIVGTVLVLGAALVSELSGYKHT